MSKNNGKTEFEFYQPAKKKSLSEMLYDPKEGTICGRTPKSWGQLFLFYGIYYIVLAALFTICMQGLLSTIDRAKPKWQLDSSLIGTNPGMGFRPLSEQTERGSVIHYDSQKGPESDYWIGLLDDFIKDYQNTEGGKVKHCDFNQTHKASDVCLVNADSFGPCSPSNQYGYKTRSPCVFLKLNKIYGWEPQYYDNAADLPDMPTSLVNHIQNETHEVERQQIWVSCNGTYGKDKEKANFEEIQFFPSQGFPAYYYPYENQPGYLSPLVAVQFVNPPKSTLLEVECRAWAKNIIYSGSIRDRMGSVTFQFVVD